MNNQPDINKFPKSYINLLTITWSFLNMYISSQKLLMFIKEVSSVHQACIYLIKIL